MSNIGLRRKRITSERMREIMGDTHTMTDDIISNKQLIWYWHVQLTVKHKVHKHIINWFGQTMTK